MSKNIILYKDGSVKLNLKLRKIENKNDVELVLIEDTGFNSFIYVNYNEIMKATKFIVKYSIVVYFYDYNDDEYEYNDKIRNYYREFNDAESFYRFIKIFHRSEYANYMLNFESYVINALDIISVDIEIYNKDACIYSYNYKLSSRKKYEINTCLPKLISDMGKSLLVNDKYNVYYKNIVIDVENNRWTTEINNKDSRYQIGYILPYVDNISFVDKEDNELLSDIQNIYVYFYGVVDPNNIIAKYSNDQIYDGPIDVLEIGEIESYTNSSSNLNSIGYILEFFNYFSYIHSVNNIILNELYCLGNTVTIVNFSINYKRNALPDSSITSHSKNPMQDIFKYIKGCKMK